MRRYISAPLYPILFDEENDRKLRKNRSGDAGDRTRVLSHAKRTLYHWATSPSLLTFLIFNSLFWKWTFYMTVLIKHWHDIYNSREATEHGVNLYSTVAFQFAPRARLIQTYFNWWDSGSEQGVTLFMAISYYAICILARRHFWQHMFSLRFTTIFFLIEDE